MAELLRIYELTHRKRPIPRLFRERLSLPERDSDIVSRYRLDRGGIEYLENILRPDLTRSTSRGHPIGSMTQVLACLRYLAKGDFYSEVGDIHGISKSSMSRILNDFLTAVNLKLDNIRFPRERDLQDEVKRGFYQSCGIPGVIGAIDGTFIPIIAPIEHEEVFLCRKGYHALNIQAVVDSRMKFLDVVAKWPGSTHDAAILDSCGLKNYLERTCPGHLLGESGYPLRGYLMTPILQPTSLAQEKYNKAHAKGRVVVERAFGVLKSRFRCLHKSGGCLPFQPGKCVQVVSACVRLHNLCQDRNIPVTSLVTEDDSDDDTQIQPNTGSGHNRRLSLVQLFQ